MTGYVYAIGNDEFVKIGFSTKPILRASKIQSDTAFECKLLGFVEATRAQEATLHNLLSEYRHNREWFFRGSTAVELFISSLPALPSKYDGLNGVGKENALLRFLKERHMDDAAFAEQMGGKVTPYAVKKWKYGETRPRLPELARIEIVTEGVVRLSDFIDEPAGGATA